MRFAKVILILALLGFAPLAARCADAPAPAPASADAGNAPAPTEGHGKTGLPAKADAVFKIGEFPVTNSMIVTWIVALMVIIFAQLATRNMKVIPDGAQNFWEFLVESLHNFLSDIVGRDMISSSFWFFATIFIFILFTNWFGLIPGVGTIGWGEETSNGFEVVRPMLRGGNADLNMTFAMSAIFMVCWLFWALKSNGIVGFALHLFGPKGETSGIIKYIMVVVFFAVGFLELLSIAFRPISLSFRLYGNIFAGENLLEAMSRVIQHPAWLKAVASALLPVPFYFFEILVGLVQALVFMLLTAVFTALILPHKEDHGHEEHKH